MKPDQHQAFTPTLRAMSDNVLRRPPEQRLRAALKTLLRAYGLRCVSVWPSKLAQANRYPTSRTRIHSTHENPTWGILDDLVAH